MIGSDLTVKGGVSTLAFALPMWIWVAAIFAVSSIPGPALTAVGITVWDKLAHGLEYAVLGFLAVRRQRRGFGRPPTPSFARAVAFGIGVGGLDEVYQSMIPGRSTDATDLVADALGVLVGSGLALVYVKRSGDRTGDGGGRIDEGD
jgi:VanZ family protein